MIVFSTKKQGIWGSIHLGSFLVSCLSVIVLVPIYGQSLRSGAPSVACLSMRPFHGLNSARPASASQFLVAQSSLSYLPEQNVTVDIETHSSERYFKGFMLQAYDPMTGTPIGSFLESEEARSMGACSSATHRNNANKKKVSLVWVPPGSNKLQPPGSSSTSRQLEEPPALVLVDELSTGSHKEKRAASGDDQQQAAKQVRFRATIVVKYDEFYTGFQSSDRQFEKFAHAPAARQAVA